MLDLHIHDHRILKWRKLFDREKGLFNDDDTRKIFGILLKGYFSIREVSNILHGSWGYDPKADKILKNGDKYEEGDRDFPNVFTSDVKDVSNLTSVRTFFDTFLTKRHNLVCSYCNKSVRLDTLIIEKKGYTRTSKRNNQEEYTSCSDRWTINLIELLCDYYEFAIYRAYWNDRGSNKWFIPNFKTKNLKEIKSIDKESLIDEIIKILHIVEWDFREKEKIIESHKLNEMSMRELKGFYKNMDVSILKKREKGLRDMQVLALENANKKMKSIRPLVERIFTCKELYNLLELYDSNRGLEVFATDIMELVLLSAELYEDVQLEDFKKKDDIRYNIYDEIYYIGRILCELEDRTLKKENKTKLYVGFVGSHWKVKGFTIKNLWLIIDDILGGDKKDTKKVMLMNRIINRAKMSKKKSFYSI